MSTVHPSGMRQSLGVGQLGAAGIAAGAALVAAGIGYKAGPVVAVAALVLLIGTLFLLAHAEWAVGLVVGLFVVCESDAAWGVPQLTRIYEQTPAKVSYFELLELLAVAAVVLSASRPGRRLQTLRPFGPALALAAFALVFGIAYGHFGGHAIRYQVISQLQNVAPLFVMPFLIVNVIRTQEQLRRVLGWVVALVLLKALAGLFVVFSGLGADNIGLGRLTYYAPASNYLLMLFLVAMLAARLGKVPVGRLAAWTVPVALVCLTLSYRRTFWLATIACLLLVLLLGSGREFRRLLPVFAVILAGTGYVVFTSGYLGDGGEVVKRAESINPKKVSRNTQDRYRLSERKNVLLALEKEPLTGLGVGVEWPGRYPLPFEQENLHSYVHFGFLYWWMKAGVLGGLAYLSLIGTVLMAGLRVWRRHPDPVVSVCGLAAGIGVLGYVIVELASSILGSDERGTAMLACTIGLLAVAHRQTTGSAAAPDRMRT